MSPSILLACAAFLLAPSFVSSAPNPPNLVYPLQGQYPPVARTNQTFSWTIYPSTFNASSGSTIALSAFNLPTWAKFDAGTSTFSGLPNIIDVGSTTITLQANASGVATGSFDSFVLMVVDNIEPYVERSIASQLPAASSFGGGASLTPNGALEVPPYWSFSLGFQQYTFQDSNFNTIYYGAVLTGTNQLPSWLLFDNRTVTFDGLAPMGSGEYSITIFGSEYFGYGDIQQTFKLSVGYHSFELLEPLPALNTTASNTVRYTIPLSGLRLDNSSVALTNLSSVVVSLGNYPYLTYNPTTRVISGTLPSSITPSELPIPVVFSDVFNNSISTNITLNVMTTLFTSPVLPTLDVYSGRAFSEDLSIYVTSSDARYNATITPTAAQQWLTFDPATLFLSGTPPSPIPSYQNASLQLTAVNPSSGVTGNSLLVLSITVNATAVSPSATSTPSPAPIAAAIGGDEGLSRSSKLAIGLTIGLVALLLLILGAIIYYRKYYEPEGERRMRREGSTLIFDDAMIAAAVKKQNEKNANEPQSAKEEKIAREKASQGWGRGGEIDAIGVAGGMRAKRFDLMGLFKSGLTATSTKSTLPIATSNSNRSLFDIGIRDGPMPIPPPNAYHNNVVIVTRPDDDEEYDGDGVALIQVQGSRSGSGSGSEGRGMAVGGADGESDLERQSSWESRGSSSLFYSEGSEAAGSPRRKVRKPHGQGRPSAPQQRRDFIPHSSLSPPPHTSNSATSLPPTNSSSSSRDQIRRVDSPLSEESEDPELFDSALFPLNATASTSHHQSSLDIGVASSTNSSFPAESSSSSLPPPRLIPFTQRRTPSQSGPHGARLPSQEALHHNSNRNSAIEDAIEEGDENRRSAIYLPPVTGSSITSAVIFPSPRETWRASNLSSEYDHSPSVGGDGIRLVSSSSPFVYEPWTSPRGHRRTATNSSNAYADSVQLEISVNEAFRFTPRLHPPPAASITSSPGRSDPPQKRSTYNAYVDPSPDSVIFNPTAELRSLPSWIHFDGVAIELWGCAKPEDIGTLNLIIVERKDVPASPTRSLRNGVVVEPPSSEGQEVVVARYGLEVKEDEEGELQVITF